MPNTTYAELQTFATTFATAEMKGVVSTSGSPSQFALMARMVHNRVASHPHKFNWLLRIYTLTLTGATSYDLSALIPDLDRIYIVYGDTVANKEVPYQKPRDYMIDFGGNTRMTIIGKTIYLSADGVTGTLTIPYFSNYLVANAAGTRQLDFSATTDTTMIPRQHENVLFEGVLELIQRKAKTLPVVLSSSGRKTAQVAPSRFETYLNQMVLTDRPIHEAIYDFRFNPAPAR